jgi:[acyl-carrier-protein] S-malonyltransferase
MTPAAEEFALTLADVAIHSPAIPVVQNVDAQSHEQPETIRDNLARQLCKPVLWVSSVQAMKSQGVTRMIEMGPGKVLTGLCKRIDKTIDNRAVFDPASLAAALAD